MDKSYKRILVPLDGSRLAEQALEEVNCGIREKSFLDNSTQSS